MPENVSMPDSVKLYAQFVDFFIKEFSKNDLPAYLTALVIGVGGATLLFLARGFIARRMSSWIARAGRYGRIDRSLGAAAIRSFLSLLPLLPIYWALNTLTFSKSLTAFIKFIFLLLFTYAVVRLIANLAGFLLDTMLRGDKDEGAAGAEAGAGALMPIIRTIVWAIGITFLLDNLGFQISSIVAGLGIMGVAVGLAGQAILADFFSYLVILMDRPFTIGDSVAFGTRSGTVEHIGVKTTRLRAATGEAIICPNGDITKQVLGNYRSARKLQQTFTFGVAYETPVEKVRHIPGMVREAAAKLRHVEIIRAHFLTFGDFSLNFEVAFAVPGRDFNTLRDAQQNLNLALMERFEKEGIIFAYPTQTLYMAGRQGAAPGAAKQGQEE